MTGSVNRDSVVTQMSVDGTAYRRYPRAGAPVMVLVHGLGLTQHTWDGHLDALTAQYDVITYDLCGHGQSAAPIRTPDLTLYADQLAALLDECDVARCVVNGFSLGGMINRRFAMDYPSRVEALVILNSPHERGPEAQALVEQRAADTSAGGPGATLDATIERWFTPSFRTEQPDSITMVREWVLANDPDTYAACRMVLATGVIELIRPQPPITQPTLVITCEHDSGSTPAMTMAIAAEISGAEAHIVPNLQHMGLMEAPALFTKPVLAFLQRVKG